MVPRVDDISFGCPVIFNKAAKAAAAALTDGLDVAVYTGSATGGLATTFTR